MPSATPELAETSAGFVAEETNSPDILIEQLRPRIEKMARYYARMTGEESHDLLQEAWLGLLEALRKADPAIGDWRQFLIQRARWRLLDAVKHARIRRMASLEAGCREPSTAKRWHPPTGEMPQPPDLQGFFAALSPLQQEVLGLLQSGLTWREAGARLGCSSANVAYHVRQIRERFGVWSRSVQHELTS